VKSGADSSLATKLLNKNCGIHAKDPKSWLNLLKHLHATGQLFGVPDVFRRALACLENPADFLSNALQYRV